MRGVWPKRPCADWKIFAVRALISFIRGVLHLRKENVWDFLLPVGGEAGGKARMPTNTPSQNYPDTPRELNNPAGFTENSRGLSEAIPPD